jgi:ribosome-associated heat shock protein Hsp15
VNSVDKRAALTRVRIDKWLWAARFFKTRALAAQAIEAGQVRIGDERVKPAHAVRLGERIVVSKAGLRFEVIVAAMSDRRGPASEAVGLYRETPESLAAREQELLRRRAAGGAGPTAPGRPTKRERRKLEDFLNEP